MAASLADSSISILLVEKQHLNQMLDSDLLESRAVKDDQFDVRVSAISPGNRSFLSSLNAWQIIPQQRQASYEQMKVWDGDGTGKIEFSAAKIAQADLGVIVENRLIQLALLKRIESSTNVKCEFGYELDSLIISEEYADLVLSNGQGYQSKLVIGADGAHSIVKKLVGIDSNENDYSQIAYVANVKTELSHQNTAWQRFTPFGPVAFLPLANNNLCSIVWSIDIDKADQLKVLTTEKFVEKLQHAFESKLGKVSAVSKHFGFPLVKRHSQSYLSHRVALIGDAAHTIHPLAGQGVNLGFQDVACLSKLITSLDDQGRDYGVRENLRPFERERKAENMIMQNAMSGFKSIFANQTMPVTLLRNFAMSALNGMPLVKDVIIKKAMGL